MRIAAVDEVAPEPMGPPHVGHVVDGDAFGLRQEEQCEESHDSQPTREEEEDAELEGTEHGQEGLGDDELEEHVGEHRYALRRRPDVLRKDLTRDEPCERPPRPFVHSHEQAHRR